MSLLTRALAYGNKSSMTPRSIDTANYEATYLAHIIVNMFFLCLMSILLGSRTGNLRIRNISSTDWIRLNIILIYIFSIGLVLVSVIVIAGVGVEQIHGCYVAHMVCAFFYLGAKVLMYIFLMADRLKIERAHVTAVPYRGRLKDMQWIMNMILLAVGFIAIATLAFGWPIESISDDGKCRVGFPEYTTLSMLVWDTCMNITVTGVFMYKLYPYLSPPHTHLSSDQDHQRIGFRSRILKRILLQYRNQEQNPVTGKLQNLLLRTTVAGVLVMLMTTANIIVLLRMGGNQQIRMCLIMCPLDLTWTVCVLHWLTRDPAKDRCNNPHHQNLKPENRNHMKSTNNLDFITIHMVDSNSTLKNESVSSIGNTVRNPIDIEAGIPDQDIASTDVISSSFIPSNDATKKGDDVC